MARSDAPRTVHLAVLMAGLIGLGWILDRVLRTTGELAGNTAYSTANGIEAAVVGVVKSFHPLEDIGQVRESDAEVEPAGLAELEAWANQTGIGADDEPDWTDELEIGMTERIAAINDAARRGAVLPPPVSGVIGQPELAGEGDAATEHGGEW